MPEKLARLLCRLRLGTRKLCLELFRLAGGSPKLYRGASVLLSPAPVHRGQLRPQPRRLKSAAPHTTRNSTARHDNNASAARSGEPLAGTHDHHAMLPLRPPSGRSSPRLLIKCILPWYI